MPTDHVATPAEIEHRAPPPGPPGGLPPSLQAAAAAQQQQQAGQSANAGQALLAMLKQQQAAQAAAAAGGGGPPQRPMLPPNAVSAADVSMLDDTDKVARLTALQVGWGRVTGGVCLLLGRGAPPSGRGAAEGARRRPGALRSCAAGAGPAS